MSVCSKVSGFFSNCWNNVRNSGASQCLSDKASCVFNAVCSGVKQIGKGIYFLDDKTVKVLSSIPPLVKSISEKNITEAVLIALQELRGICSVLTISSVTELVSKGSSLGEVLSGETNLEESAIPYAELLPAAVAFLNLIIEGSSAIKSYQFFKAGKLEVGDSLAVRRVMNNQFLKRISNIIKRNPDQAESVVKSIFGKQTLTSAALMALFVAIIGVSLAEALPLGAIFGATAFATAAKVLRYAYFTSTLKESLFTPSSQRYLQHLHLPLSPRGSPPSTSTPPTPSSPDLLLSSSSATSSATFIPQISILFGETSPPSMSPTFRSSPTDKSTPSPTSSEATSSTARSLPNRPSSASSIASSTDGQYITSLVVIPESLDETQETGRNTGRNNVLSLEQIAQIYAENPDENVLN